jgi:NO-binding membrane sensor protein with MHYT domain
MVQYHMELNPFPLLVACFVSFVGAYGAITTLEQYRLCEWMSLTPKLFPRKIELLILSILLGGVATWATHFVAMSACTLEYDGDKTSPVFFRVDVTVASLVASVILNYVGKEDIFTFNLVFRIDDCFVSTQAFLFVPRIISLVRIEQTRSALFIKDLRA